MNINDLIGGVFTSPEIEDGVFFKLAIVNDIARNYTVVEHDAYLFQYGRGLVSVKPGHSHITVFNRFYKNRLEYSHKAIITIFGGIGELV